jgi:hypothetical protein
MWNNRQCIYLFTFRIITSVRAKIDRFSRDIERRDRAGLMWCSVMVYLLAVILNAPVIYVVNIAL